MKIKFIYSFQSEVHIDIVKILVSKDKDGFIVYSSHKAIAESEVCAFKFSEMISHERVLIRKTSNLISFTHLRISILSLSCF